MTEVTAANTTTHEEPQRGGEKYDRILEAAIDIIAKNGYFNARITEIAQRAGVADGTVYLYFKNKDAILRAAIDSGFREFFVRVQAAVDAAPDARQKLEVVARLHLEALARSRNLAVVMQTEVRQSARFVSDFSHRHIVDYLTLLRAVVRDGQQAGELRADVSDWLAANCIFGALDETVSSWVFTGRPYDAAIAARQIVDLFLRGLAQE